VLLGIGLGDDLGQAVGLDRGISLKPQRREQCGIDPGLPALVVRRRY
jgi:hypothetical protein